jgi:rhamnose transport system permease protein
MKRYFRELSVAGALSLMLLALAIFAPAFYQPQPLLSLATREAPVLVVACGMAIVILGRQIDISVGSQFAVCSVSAGLLAARGWPLALVLPAAVALGADARRINGLLVAGLGLPSIVVTLAMMVTLAPGPEPRAPGPVRGSAGRHPVVRPQTRPPASRCSSPRRSPCCSRSPLALRHLAAGRFVYALGSDAEAARLAGLRPRLGTFLVFVLLGALTGLAAMMNVVQSPAGAAALRHRPRTRSHRRRRGRRRGHLRRPRHLWGVFAGLLLLACVPPRSRTSRIEAYWEKAIQGAIILLAVMADGLRKLRAALI